MQRKHIAGKKIAGNHSSVIPLAYDVIRFALTLPSVDRCAPGKITVKKTNSKALQISYDQKFITLNVVDRGLIQRILIFGSRDQEGALMRVVEELIKWAEAKKIRHNAIDKR